MFIEVTGIEIRKGIGISIYGVDISDEALSRARYQEYARELEFVFEDTKALTYLYRWLHKQKSVQGLLRERKDLTLREVLASIIGTCTNLSGYYRSWA